MGMDLITPTLDQPLPNCLQCDLPLRVDELAFVDASRGWFALHVDCSEKFCGGRLQAVLEEFVTVNRRMVGRQGSAEHLTEIGNLQGQLAEIAIDYQSKVAIVASEVIKTRMTGRRHGSAAHLREISRLQGQLAEIATNYQIRVADVSNLITDVARTWTGPVASKRVTKPRAGRTRG